MGNQRILLYLTLFFIVYMIWAQWQIEYGPKPEPVVAGQSVQSNGGVLSSEDIPQAVDTTDGEPSILPVVKDAVISERIKVITDILEIEIDTKGGDVSRVVLRNYSVTAAKPEDKLVLVTDANINYQVAQSGLVSVNKGTAPSHNAIYKSERSEYRLAEGTDVIEVPLYWENSEGVKIKKVLTFKRDDYVIDVDYYITAGMQKWSGSDYMQITRSRPVEESANAFIRTYTGGVVYNEEIKYEKYDFDDIADENLSYQLKDGWLAMIQH
ncbi:MAG: membrane protein insertase YidC, partial [Gammaproteobacteria bacterium]|nr:membrane protein insertase YidC [Gammaproteobacteria bacterium]